MRSTKVEQCDLTIRNLMNLELLLLLLLLFIKLATLGLAAAVAAARQLAKEKQAI